MTTQRPDNVYEFFLKIPPSSFLPGEISPDHYTLLGLPRFSNDAAALKQAGIARSTELRGWDNSNYHLWSNELLDEVVKAMLVLESRTSKADYDRQLRRLLKKPEPAPNLAVASDVLASVSEGDSHSIDIPESPFAFLDSAIAANSKVTGKQVARQSPVTAGEWNYDQLFLRIASLIAVVGLVAVITAVILPRRGMRETSTTTLAASREKQRPAVQIPSQSAIEPMAESSDMPTADNPSSSPKLDAAPVPEPQSPATRFSPPLDTTNPPVSLTNTAPVPPKLITSKSTGMMLTLISAGTFTMGSPAGEAGRFLEEGPQHSVKISQPFYLGVYEVTQGEYESVMGTNPSSFKSLSGQDTSKFPVEMVSWNDAAEFCRKLSLKDGQNYRLPTEAEWEYACRAGTTTPFHFGSSLNGDNANVDGTKPYGTTTRGQFLQRTTTVGSYAQNDFGLFDMHGNVWEWCEDAYYENAYRSRNGTPADPMVTSGPANRVLRGGGWGGSQYARSAYRNKSFDNHKFSTIGFRVVRSAAPVGNSNSITPQLTRGSTNAPILGRVAGEARDDNVLRLKLCWCPPGSFTLGSPTAEVGRGSYETQVSVTFSTGFWMGKYEVTQGEWRTIMKTTVAQQRELPGNKTSVVGEGVSKPMQFVNRADSMEFCAQLTELERRESRLPPGWVYRLPTEAEWEYACRAETGFATAFGDTLSKDMANYDWKFTETGARGNPLPLDVGSYQPNGWGLCDCHGNVGEWCADEYVTLRPSSRDPFTAPTQNGLSGVIRGGSCQSPAKECRSAFRQRTLITHRAAALGFRVVLGRELK